MSGDMTMSETYKTLAEFAQTWGLLYFLVLFLLVIAYAFWPTRRQQFDAAARVPLRED
jgi:cytochrome c oxidase cbb3-type subunit IV